MTFERKIRAVPKPEGTKKSKKSGPTKTVDDDAVKDKQRRQNNINRNFGKAVERNVAKLTGGVRVPMSGAIKNSVHNLEGDVQIRSPDDKKLLVLVECKGTAGINPKGEKVFSLKKSVLDQIKKEAEQQHALPVTYIHWKDANYRQDDYVIIPVENFLQLLEDMKTLYELEVQSNENSE